MHVYDICVFVGRKAGGRGCNGCHDCPGGCDRQASRASRFSDTGWIRKISTFHFTIINTNLIIVKEIDKSKIFFGN